MYQAIFKIVTAVETIENTTVKSSNIKSLYNIYIYINKYNVSA